MEGGEVAESLMRANVLVGMFPAAQLAVAGSKGGDGEVSEKSLKMRQFLVYLYPEEERRGPSWVAGVARMKGMTKTGPTEVIGRILEAGQDQNGNSG
ncbi:MAG: hypothetical protein NVS9B4_10270 [Candidatus Acidiferrum sp.]